MALGFRWGDHLVKRIAVLWVALVVASLTSCTRSSNWDREQTPDRDTSCDDVALIHGELDGAELRALFDCLNNMGSLSSLEPLMNDLESTINPDTGQPYLEDVAAMTSLTLAYDDAGEVLDVLDGLSDNGTLHGLTPLAAEVIETGLAEALLPVALDGIESGAVQDMLEPTAQVLRDPDLPELLAGLSDLLEQGASEGWIDDLVDDTASVLVAVEPEMVDASATYLASGEAEALLPVADQLIDDGTVQALGKTNRALYDQGVLQQLDTQLRPMFVQDANGYSHMQGLLTIIDGTNQPLSCLGITLTDNLAVTILDVMADRTEQDIQDLVSILESTLGLADIFCSIPPEVQEHFDSLDALANSGALDGLLPLLRVFQAQDRLPELVEIFVALDENQALPALEPVILRIIDDGIADRIVDLVPHFVDPSGEYTSAADTTMGLLDRLVSPATPGQPSTAPLHGLLTVLGEAAGEASTPIADGLQALGQTILDGDSSFSDFAPALSAALAADPDAALAHAVADFIDDGAVARGLDPLAESIRSGHLEKLLPWIHRVLVDGTVDAVIDLFAGAVDLLAAD